QTLLNGGYGVTNTFTGTAPAQTATVAGASNNFRIDVDNAGPATALTVTLTTNRVYDAAVTADRASLESALNSAISTAFTPGYGAGSVPISAKVAVTGTGAASRFVTTFSSTNPTQQFQVDLGAANDFGAAIGVTATTASTIAGSSG